MKISRFIVIAVFGLGLISQSAFVEAEVEGCRNCYYPVYDGRASDSLRCECKKDDGSYGEYSERHCPDGRYINKNGRLDCDPALFRGIIARQQQMKEQMEKQRCMQKPLPEDLKEQCEKAGF